MRAITVLETNILHASDVIYWLDGSSAELPIDMLRIASAVELQLTKRPRDLMVVSKMGKTAFLRRPTEEIIDGEATTAEKIKPIATPYALEGVVRDLIDRVIPRQFSIDAGNGAGHALVIYPSPLGVRLGPSGGLQGTLRFSADESVVPWAILTLSVTTAVLTTMKFRTQTTAHGDFVLSLQRLPPLPKGIDEYAATLSVQVGASATPEVPIDIDDADNLVAKELGNLDAEDTFAVAIALAIVPGELRLIRSAKKDHLAVKTN